MELTATNRPRAWPEALKGRKVDDESKDVGVYVVLKVYGNGERVRRGTGQVFRGF